MKALILGTLFIVLGITGLRAETSEQLWLDINPSWWPNEDIEVFGDLGYRTEFNNNDWHRVVVRPGVAIPYKKVNFTAGLGNFMTFHNVVANRWELRPFQGVSFDWPRRERFKMGHYFRVEERFDFNTRNWNSLNSLRLRYQLSATYRFPGARLGKSWAAVGMAEVFLTPVGDEAVQRENFRVTLGLQREIGVRHSIRFELSWQQRDLLFRPSQSADEFFFRIRYFL